MTSITLSSHAKINLFLEVLGPRDDGFHDLDTLFCEIDWGDTLTFTKAQHPEIVLSCSAPGFPLGPENLISRALAPFVRESGGVQVEIQKELPMGGGLGGGSSNAAAALLAGERLFAVPLEKSERAKRALDLGSDVPFFLEGGCQRGLGRGEQLTPYPVPDLDLVIVTPGIHCSTGKVFQSLRAKPRTAFPIKEMLAAVQSGDREAIAGALFNRLEDPSFELWPRLAELKKELIERGCLGALMSGSGSSLFGIARDRDHAEQIASDMANARAVRTLAREARGA